MCLSVHLDHLKWCSLNDFIVHFLWLLCFTGNPPHPHTHILLFSILPMCYFLPQKRPCFLWLEQHLPLLTFYQSYCEAPSFFAVSVAVWRLMLPLLLVLVTGLNIGGGTLKTTTNKITLETSSSSSERSPLSR